MNTTQKSYVDRLNRVTAFMHANLERDIGIEELSEIACLSSYHWHRIYTAMRGETVATTLRRLRLQLACERLANSDMGLAEIARLAGYGSNDAFGRAFKLAYGQTPTEYRTKGSHALFKAAVALIDADGFEVIVEKTDPVRCAAVSHQGAYMKIDAAMGQLFGILAQNQLVGADTKMLAVFLDDPDLVERDELRSFACSPLADNIEIPDGVIEKIIDGGICARLAYKGPYSDMKGAYRWLYGVWLPASGFEAAEHPCFEAYLNSPVDTAPEDLRTDISLPIKRP